MRGTVGAVMYDGWTANSTHFVCVIASYCTNVSKKTDKRFVTEAVPRISLISLSPLGHIQELVSTDDGNSNDEATTSNAESHIGLFEKTFEWYELNLHEWCVCFIADNAAVNMRISRFSNKPHIGCANHKLNLEVNKMTKDHWEVNA